MKAIVKARAEPGLWLEDVPVPKVRGDDVLIRVLKASICGTDVHIYNWDAWAQKAIPVPMIIGHEFVGVVDRVGDHVKGFGRGDLVVAEGHITCGHCRNCLAGRRHLCPNTQGVGVNRPGGWAEFVAIPQENCWHADPSIPLDVRTEQVTEAMQNLGMKEGFDVALEMSGNPKAFADILPNMFHGGNIALLGIMPGSAAIDWNTVVFSALTIKGVYGREMYETWYKMTAMIQSGLDISPVITHHFPYTEFKEAIEMMKSGSSGKIVLNWGER